MNREDVDNLFELLKIYFPNTPKVHSKTLKNAWLLILEPYDPKAVKKALVERLRENKNFPDPQAVAEKCNTSVKADAPPVDRYAPPSPTARKHMAELRAWQEDWHRELHEQGLPTLREAIAAGMSLAEWHTVLNDAGVWK